MGEFPFGAILGRAKDDGVPDWAGTQSPKLHRQNFDVRDCRHQWSISLFLLRVTYILVTRIYCGLPFTKLNLCCTSCTVRIILFFRCEKSTQRMKAKGMAGL